MKHDGRGVIRIGDKTSHGGMVLSASSGTVVMGRPAALEDDMTVCPQCKGKYAIKPDGAGAKHEGKPYAYHNDRTECGALLISSLSWDSGSVNANISAISKQDNSSKNGFNDRFVLLDEETGKPIEYIEYAIKRETGEVEYGVTNNLGETHLLSTTAAAECVIVYVAA